MTINFNGPTTTAQMAERASSMIEDGNRLAVLASHLAEYEEATGRRLFVSEADQGVRYVGQGGMALGDAGPVPAFSDGIKTATSLTDAEVMAKLAVPALGDELTGLRAPLPGCDCAPDAAGASQDEAGACGSPSAAPMAPPEAKPASAARTEAVAQVAPDKPAARKQPLKAPTDRPWGTLSLPERRIVQHLERLPDTFAPADDLKLVEMLAHGNKIPVVAALLEVEPAVALDRWKAMLCDDVIGLDGKPTITGQAALLKALRYRAEVGA